MHQGTYREAQPIWYTLMPWKLYHIGCAALYARPSDVIWLPHSALFWAVTKANELSKEVLPWLIVKWNERFRDSFSFRSANEQENVVVFSSPGCNGKILLL